MRVDFDQGDGGQLSQRVTPQSLGRKDHSLGCCSLVGDTVATPSHWKNHCGFNVQLEYSFVSISRAREKGEFRRTRNGLPDSTCHRGTVTCQWPRSRLMLMFVDNNLAIGPLPLLTFSIIYIPNS